MQVEKRATGTYRARVRIKGQPQLSRTFRTEHAAREWATAIEDAAKGGKLAEVIAADITLADALRQYSEKVTPGKRGAEHEQRRIRYLLTLPLANLKLSALSRAVLRQHRDRRFNGGLSGASWNRELSLISQVLRWAVAERDAAIDVRALVAGLRGRESAGRDRVLSNAEEASLLAAAPPVDPLLAPVIILLIETGLRRSELLAARREHISGRRLTVPTSKNGKARTIVLSDRALVALEQLPARLDGRLIDWLDHQVTGRFRMAVQRAGIEHVTVHDCRHTAITRWILRDGLTVGQARMMSGHRTMSAFTRYLNADVDALALIEQRLAA